MKGFIQEKPNLLGLVLIILMVFLLSACATQAGPTQPALQERLPPIEETAPATHPEEGEIIASKVPTLSPEPDSSTPSPEPGIQPTPRLDLHATDPSGVTLAAGKPQLIEFFAFW